MKAIQIQQFGEPASALKLIDAPRQWLRDGDVRVRIEAAGINPSDVVNIRGGFSSTTLPRTPGRDFAGEVVEGPERLIGLRVWGTGSDIGSTRDGTHAESIDIPAEAVAERPAALSAE